MITSPTRSTRASFVSRCSNPPGFHEESEPEEAQRSLLRDGTPAMFLRFHVRGVGLRRSGEMIIGAEKELEPNSGVQLRGWLKLDGPHLAAVNCSQVPVQARYRDISTLSESRGGGKQAQCSAPSHREIQAAPSFHGPEVARLRHSVTRGCAQEASAHADLITVTRGWRRPGDVGGTKVSSRCRCSPWRISVRLRSERRVFHQIRKNLDLIKFCPCRARPTVGFSMNREFWYGTGRDGFCKLRTKVGAPLCSEGRCAVYDASCLAQRLFSVCSRPHEADPGNPCYPLPKRARIPGKITRLPPFPGASSGETVSTVWSGTLPLWRLSRIGFPKGGSRLPRDYQSDFAPHPSWILCRDSGSQDNDELTGI